MYPLTRLYARKICRQKLIYFFYLFPEERICAFKKTLATALHLRYTDAKQFSILVVDKRSARSFNIFIQSYFMKISALVTIFYLLHQGRNSQMG